jgi:hypothetical protein
MQDTVSKESITALQKIVPVSRDVHERHPFSDTSGEVWEERKTFTVLLGLL